jgi:TPR repeat protein
MADEEEKKILEEIERNIKNPNAFNREDRARSLGLKTKDEAKEYLDNLFTEYTFQCYGEKLVDGCYRLANYHENITHNFQEAAKIHKNICDNNDFERSCYHYGNSCLLGRGVKKDEVEGFKYHLKSCHLNNKRSCLMAGVMTYYGRNVALDSKLGFKCLEKACDLKEPEACLELFKINFDEKSQYKNRQNAVEFAKKSCELGNLYGCVNASLMYKKGDGIPKDENLAKFYREKAETIQNLLDNPPPSIVFGERHQDF